MSNKHAQWDALLTDIERQLEQQRHIRPRRLVIQGLTAAGVVFGGGAAFGALALRLIQGG
jgi:hypothetical protein